MPMEHEELEAIFDTGENVGDSWKHRIWRGLSHSELLRVRQAASYFYGCNESQVRVRRNLDGTHDFEAVYGCEGGDYTIEDWDGTVLIGPNRRALAREWPVDLFVLYEVRGQRYVGHIKRHSRKTISISQTGHVTAESDGAVSWRHIDGPRRWWRIPWGLIDETIIDRVSPS